MGKLKIFIMSMNISCYRKIVTKNSTGQAHQFLGSLDLCGFEALSNIHLIWSKNALQASKINAW
jgi:hypothetical protein